MKLIVRIVFFLLFTGQCFGQDKKGIKLYPPDTKAGEITLISSQIKSDGIVSSKTFTIYTEKDAAYELKAICALLENSSVQIFLDNTATGLNFTANTNGWQKLSAGIKGKTQQIFIPAGKHEINFSVKGDMIPMVDDIYFQSNSGTTEFDRKWESVKLLIEKAAMKPLNIQPVDKVTETSSNFVLSNPEGIYNHDINRNFSYTTFSWIFLTAGTTVTFKTKNSSVDPVLYLFSPSNIDNYSWSDDDGGLGNEALLTVNIPETGNYVLVVRPFGEVDGTTTITKNGITYLSNTPIGGLRFLNPDRSGELNFFTCKLTGDTRMFTSHYSGVPFNGYNDDYTGTGDWDWGLASRIKKDFIKPAGRAFVSAYSLMTTGICDVYMGNPNSVVNSNTWPMFPLLNPDDAIESANVSNKYNCISWTGGVTAKFIWPPNWSSSYNCTGDPKKTDCFDNFYANTPVVRYPKAWNYTRSNANSANSVIDLWAVDGEYTHASVRKPGNEHPHGYEWESKHGINTRMMHPRNALDGLGFGYGAVKNYYKFTGTYANAMAVSQSFATDIDAVKAGVAVFENVRLSVNAQDKLKRLIGTIDKNATDRFNELYLAWQRTWKDNSIYSNPDAYCRNSQFDTLAGFCKNTRNIIFLVFDKYIDGDIFIGKIVWDMTRDKYSKLLEEAKMDFIRNQYDEQGRYKIHGDHDNGIRYIEKIMNVTDDIAILEAEANNFSISISPNPVKDFLMVHVTTTEKATLSIQLVSIQSNKSMWIQIEKEYPAGLHRFTASIASLGLNNGDIVAIKVINGKQHKTVKALVVK